MEYWRHVTPVFRWGKAENGKQKVENFALFASSRLCVNESLAREMAWPVSQVSVSEFAFSTTDKHGSAYRG
jgi:hypothetical protein